MRTVNSQPGISEAFFHPLGGFLSQGFWHIVVDARFHLSAKLPPELPHDREFFFDFLRPLVRLFERGFEPRGLGELRRLGLLRASGHWEIQLLPALLVVRIAVRAAV